MNSCHGGSAAFCHSGLTGPGGASFTSIVSGDATIRVEVVSNVCSISFGYSDTNTTRVALNADASTAILAQTLTGWGASKAYTCRFGMRVTMWKDATKAHSGSLDCTIDAYVTTDGAGVATVAFGTTPYFDPSLLVAGLSGAAATVAASAGGFTVSATRVAGIASTAIAHWWCVTREDIT